MKVTTHNRNNSSWLQYSLLIGCLLLSSFSYTVKASESSDTDSPFFIEGYDVVSYFQSSRPLQGNTNFQTNYGGHTMLFINQENLDKFMANPDTYLPAYNGYCAYGMVYGMKSKIDPLQYDIVNGRLYLQLDNGTKRRWSRRIKRNIRRSDKAWGKLLSSNEAN